MRFQSLVATVALSLAMASAQAAQPPSKISVPFKPSGTLIAQLDVAGVWAEVYPATATEVPAALGRGMQGLAPVEKVAAIVVQSTLHFTMGKTTMQLPELSAQTMRKGFAVDYDEECKVFPKNGDNFIASYGKPGDKLTAELDVKIIKYLPFSEESDEPLDLSKPGDCEKETHSRMFLSGELRVKENGKLQHSIPVLMQSIVDTHYD